MESVLHDEQEFPALVTGGNRAAVAATEEEEWEMLEEQQLFDKEVVMVSNPKQLKHATSSPDLRRYSIDMDQYNNDGESDNRDSFSLVSKPLSVATTWSNNLSFKDAVLTQPETDSQEQGTGKGVKFQDPDRYDKPRKFNPKIVVQPIKRCTKSTGDLQALASIHEEEEILGETDATDFYYRKAKGEAGRKNGLKLRPDEAKRRDMILHKKALQQSQQRR